MIILHITDIKNSKANGVAVAVSSYVKHLNKKENVALYNLNDDINVENAKIFNYNNFNSINELPKPYNTPNLVVFNEVYKVKYLNLYKECLKMNIPYIIIPHGCLMKKSQTHKIVKKKVANILLFNKFINNAAAIQFLNENEQNESKFKYKKAFISGNGIDTPEYKNEYNKNNKDLIFIGRYTIKIKGLDLLVNVCKKHKQWFIDNNVKIQLYGRSSNNDLEKLIKLIKKANVENIIIINNAVYGKEKEQILKNSYAFIQLSRHEGQPMGIIEALSIGIPCIVTNGTSFADFVNNNKCGIGIKFNNNEVFNAIKMIYENEDLRNEYSNNSITITNNIFNWENIIDNLIIKYKEIIK